MEMKLHTPVMYKKPFVCIACGWACYHGDETTYTCNVHIHVMYKENLCVYLSGWGLLPWRPC